MGVSGYVKKEKTKKIPKRDNASRKEKKINIKASPGGQKREKSEIPFYRSIAMRLVGAFLIPVIGVLVRIRNLRIVLSMKWKVIFHKRRK